MQTYLILSEKLPSEFYGKDLGHGLIWKADTREEISSIVESPLSEVAVYNLTKAALQTLNINDGYFITRQLGPATTLGL